MFHVINGGMILCLFIDWLLINEIYCSTLLRPAQQEAASLEVARPNEYNLIKKIEDSISHEDFNTYPPISANMTRDQFGYSAYSDLIDYISHHLSSMVPAKYEPSNSNDNFTALFGSKLPVEMEWHSTSRSFSSGNSEPVTSSVSKLIVNGGLPVYMTTAESVVDSITTQVASIAKRGLDGEIEDVKWMMDNKQVQPGAESSPVKPVAASSARGLGEDIKSLINDKKNNHGPDLGHHHGPDLGHHHGLDLGQHHDQHSGLNIPNLPGLGKSNDDKNVFESVGGNFKDAIKNSFEDIGGEILSKGDILHKDNHDYQHNLHQLGQHRDHHYDHHHDHQFGHHQLGEQHNHHFDHHQFGPHHDHQFGHHNDHRFGEHRQHDSYRSEDDKNVFQSAAGALKDSIDNISGGIGNNKKSSELNEPGLLKGPAKLVNSVLKTSIDTVKSSSKEMNSLGDTINDSKLGSGLGKLLPGALQALGGGVSLGEKTLETATKTHKNSKHEEDPDASFYEDDDPEAHNNPGLFDGGKRKYFSKECRFRVACEIGRTVMSPMPTDLLKQYSENKYMKDFQNKYTKAMTFGVTRKACDRYYCVLVNMMGGPGPFATGVMELFLKKSV